MFDNNDYSREDNAFSPNVNTASYSRGRKKKSGISASVLAVCVAVSGLFGFAGGYVSDVLGMSSDEVKEAIKDGKVGDLLIADGKVDEFKAAYLVETKTKLNNAVTDGKLTQAEADLKYTEAEEKMAAYDGATHLCGGSDHSKMFNREKEPVN